MPEQTQKTRVGDSEARLEITAMSIAAVRGLRTESSKQHDQWRLFLTGGNGGGLLAISAILVTDAGTKWTDALLSSAWLFALGMISAGVLPLLQVVGARGLSAMIKATPSLVSEGPGLAGSETEANFHRHHKRVMIAGKAERVLEPLSVLSFLAALVIPLISFSLYGR